jgi:ATP adenylyltransferase
LLVVGRRSSVLAVLNLYPYNNGHLLVSPLRHVAELAGLTPQERTESLDLLAGFTERYRQLLRAEGFNIGLNLGTAAGAGVPGHLHWHLVPRWPGDSNFMPATGSVRVLSQSLAALWEALAEKPG